MTAKSRQPYRRQNFHKLWVYLLMALQSNAHSAPLRDSLAAKEDVLLKALVGLSIALIALVAWELYCRRQDSRSSLDIAKLAAAAAKKQSTGSNPSGSYGSITPPPQTSPFAPPPPPPPPPAPPAVGTAPEASKAFPAAIEPGFAPAPGAGAASAFAQKSSDEAGSSGGWADLLQRVRAGEPNPEAGTDSPFPGAFAPETTSPSGHESPIFPTGTLDATPATASPSSSSEAWEALLKRTTSSETTPSVVSKDDASDKISLNTSFQPFAQPAAPSNSPFGGVGPSLDFSLGSQTSPSQPSQTIGVPQYALPQPPAAPFSAESIGFAEPPLLKPEEPSFMSQASGSKEPAAGFQLSLGEAAGTTSPPPSPLNLPGLGESSPSSTLPLSDLFAAKSSPQSQPFQLPGASRQAPGVQPPGAHDDAASANLGRTISLDFLKGGGQAPPPPLPKTEG